MSFGGLKRRSRGGLGYTLACVVMFVQAARYMLKERR